MSSPDRKNHPSLNRVPTIVAVLAAALFLTLLYASLATDSADRGATAQGRRRYRPGPILTPAIGTKTLTPANGF